MASVAKRKALNGKEFRFAVGGLEEVIKKLVLKTIKAQQRQPFRGGSS